MNDMIMPHRLFNVEKVREEYPVFFSQAADMTSCIDNYTSIIHLNNAATTHKPLSVIQAVSDFYRNDNANVHRASQLISAKTTHNFESARCTLQQFLNARYTEEVIWTKGATESINLVAQSWGRAHLTSGDEIVLMASEHHANIVPWQQVAKEVGAVIRVVPVTSDAVLDLQVFSQLLNDKTRLVGIGHVSNATGRINPVERIIAMAHEVGAVVLVDGAQAASHFAIDVQALGCDFYVVSGHKIYGPNGIGVLYGRRELLEKMSPWQTGGGMVSKVSFNEEACFNPLPFKLEAGTPNIAAVLGLAEAVHYLQAFDRQSIIAHETQLLQRLYDGLNALPGIHVIGERDFRAGVISFTSADHHHQDLSLLLSNSGIIIRSGHHCAMPLMESLGLKGTLRVSVAMYTTNEDVERFLQVLKAILLECVDGTNTRPESKKSSLSGSWQKVLAEVENPQIVNALLKRHNWSSRYREIMRLGKSLPEFPEALRCEEYLIPGCESQVWLVIEHDERVNTINCYSDSDSGVMRGLIALLLTLVNGKSPQMIMEAPLESWFDQLGLVQHLSPTRGSGLRTMLEAIRIKARQYLIKDDAFS